ncbi:MAG: hypothetical protein U1F20_10875 [Lysobacterales bacterium]
MRRFVVVRGRLVLFCLRGIVLLVAGVVFLLRRFIVVRGRLVLLGLRGIVLLVAGVVFLLRRFVGRRIGVVDLAFVFRALVLRDGDVRMGTPGERQDGGQQRGHEGRARLVHGESSRLRTGEASSLR